MANRKYLAIFVKTDDGYNAYCPDLPGVISAGDTLEETERLIDEAIEIYIDEQTQKGWSVPEPSACSKYIDVKVA